MKLIAATVKNFRSLKDVSVTFDSHTALIGGNGAGKSSILKAIERFYSTTKVLDQDDFFGRDQSEPVEIELTFDELSEQETDTFETRVRDGQLVVSRVFDTSSRSGRYFGSVPQNPDFAAIRAHPTAAPKNTAYRDLRTQNPDYAELPAATSAAAAEANMRAWEEAHPEQLELMPDDGNFFGFQNAGRGALKRHTSFVFIPAVREASVDASDGKSSAIGKLLELIVRSAILQREDVLQFKAEMTERYQELVSADNMPELGTLAGQLTDDLKGLYRDAAVGLEWREVEELPVPLPMADVSLSDDGFGGPVDRQGHGLQRAFVLTLLQHLARTSVLPEPAENDVDPEAVNEEQPQVEAPSVILAIEEPELYQHPTKQRHFTSVLRGLSEGTLPGAESSTQIMFCSHSPMFVSLERADEIRLARRTECEGSDYKHCSLQSLDLGEVAQKLETACQKPAGSFSAETLVPRLHILGTELAEGFFANGVVLVEGRSDKAALVATAKLLGCDFEAAGIAVLSAEGKPNLDRPYAIFRDLGIPVFVIWDCDNGNQENDTNLLLLRLVRPDEDLQEPEIANVIGDHYAHFGNKLEAIMRDQLSQEVKESCLATACEPYGITPGKDAQKVPEIMFQTLSLANQQGHSCQFLEDIVKAIWVHLQGEEVPVAA